MNLQMLVSQVGQCTMIFLAKVSSLHVALNLH